MYSIRIPPKHSVPLCLQLIDTVQDRRLRRTNYILVVKKKKQNNFEMKANRESLVECTKCVHLKWYHKTLF